MYCMAVMTDMSVIGAPPFLPEYGDGDLQSALLDVFSRGVY
jgi:hypothetical protein